MILTFPKSFLTVDDDFIRGNPGASGKRLQFANWKMAIEFVDLPTMVIFHSFLYVYQRVYLINFSLLMVKSVKSFKHDVKLPLFTNILHYYSSKITDSGSLYHFISLIIHE